MSGFRFDDVDYDEHIEEVVERVGEASVAKPHNPYGADEKWFVKETAKDEFEDDFDERVPEDLTKIKSRIDTYTNDVDWKNIKKMIQTLQKSTGRFLKRGKTSREIVSSIIEAVRTLVEEWSSQEDTKKNKVFEETKVLVDTVATEVDAFEEDSDASDDDDDEEVTKGAATSEGESKEDPIKVLARRMTEALASKRNARRLIRDVIVEAKKLQQANIVVFALSSLIRFTLDQFSHEKCLSVQGWKEVLSAFVECKNIIQTNKLIVAEAQVEYTPEPANNNSTSDATVTAEKEKEVFAINYTTPRTTIVAGGLRGLYESLFEEMRRMLNNNEKQFVQCLEAECRIVDIGFELLNDRKNARIQLLLFSILSQRTPALHEALCKRFNLQTPFDVNGMYQQCKGGEVAMLQYAYHLALIGKYRQAKNVLVSDFASGKLFKQDEDWSGNRFMEIKENASTAVKIAYNRVIVQLAIAHFKDGNVAEAAELLSSIREHAAKWGILFGQGCPFNNFQLPKEMRAKTTMLFNSVQTPPHYQIPQVSVELMYFVAISMKRALETSQGLQSFDRDTFSALRRNVNDVAGSASTSTEFILAFDDSLQAGDIPKMVHALNSLPIWAFLDGNTSKVKIVQKAKAIALQCFIFSSAANFTTITSKYLQERFDMSEADVRKTINHTILTSPEHLTAYWEDNSEQSIVVERCNVAGLRKTLGQAARNTSAIQAPAL